MLAEAAKHIRDGILLGRTDIIKALLDEVKSAIKAEKEDGNDDIENYESFLSCLHSSSGTFLHEAVQHGKKDVVRALLQEGADATVVDGDNQSPIDISTSKEMQQVFAGVLLQAIASNNIQLSEQLIRGGLNVNTTWDTEATRNSPLHWAATFGSPEMLQILIDRWGAEVNSCNASGESPLHEAVNKNNLEISRILLENGADINSKPTQGKFLELSCAEIVSSKGDDYQDMKKLFEMYTNRVENESSLANGSIVSEANDSIETGDSNRQESKLNDDTHLKANNNQYYNIRVSPVPKLITDERLNLLWPQPTFIQQLSSNDECLNKFPRKMPISISPGKYSVHRILDVFDSHKSYLGVLKRRVHLDETFPILPEEIELKDQSINSVLWVTLNEALFPKGSSEAYRLTISNNRIRITAADLCGLHNAMMTLVQLFTLFNHSPDEEKTELEERVLKIVTDVNDVNRKQSGANDSVDGNNRCKGIVSLHITDEPDLSVRAALLDLNPYGRVPSMETLMQMIDEWAKLKINQFHAFVRLGQQNENFLCYSKSDLLTIDRYCRDRFIDFVPAIDVDASITSQDQLIQFRTKFSDILSSFDHPRYVHIGPKLTSLLFEDVAHMTVRLNIRNILPIAPDTTIILCGNSLKNSGISPEKINPNTIVIHYGFQKQDSLTSSLSSFSSAGIAVWICTGTAAWSNLAGWPDSAMSNGCSAIKSLTKVRGMGSVTANWSSHPAFTHSVFAWPGFIIGAGLAWNTNTPESFLCSTLSDLLDVHILGDLSMMKRLPPLEENEADILSPGRSLLELGRAENLLDERRRKKSLEIDFRSKSPNSDSTLLRLLLDPDQVSFDGIDIEDFGVVVQHIRRAQIHLQKCPPPSGPRYEFHRQEMYLTSELLLISARIGRALRTAGVQPGSRMTPGKPVSTQPAEASAGFVAINIGIANLQPTFRTDIANKLLSLVEQYRALWLSRYQSQGLQGSLLVLSNLLRKFIPVEPL